MKRRHFLGASLGSIALGALGPSHLVLAQTLPRTEADVEGLPAVGAAQRAPVRRPLEGYPVVGLRHHHLSAPAELEWVLVRPVDPPSSFTIVQPSRIHGCTVSGQLEVAIGARTATHRVLTFVGRTSVVSAVDEVVELGVGDRDFGSGTLTWWQAYPVPEAVRTAIQDRDVVAFPGRLSLTVVGGAPPEGLQHGVFTTDCGASLPSLESLTGRSDSDGELFCIGRGEAVIQSRGTHGSRDAQPGRDYLQSYRSAYIADRIVRQVQGRFLRIARHGRRTLMVVDFDGEIRAHQVR